MVRRNQEPEIPVHGEMFVVWSKELTGTCLMERRGSYSENESIYEPRKILLSFCF
jgi:hypothetical protein